MVEHDGSGRHHPGATVGSIPDEDWLADLDAAIGRHGQPRLDRLAGGISDLHELVGRLEERVRTLSQFLVHHLDAIEARGRETADRLEALERRLAERPLSPPPTIVAEAMSFEEMLASVVVVDERAESRLRAVLDRLDGRDPPAV